MARDDKELSEFARWLTRRMGVLGLKNADVARATSVTGPAVSLWRTGVNVPDNDRIDDLADVLQVTPETILIKLGRMKPREGITKEWEDIITRFQDAGPEAERLLFALGDALLLALHRNRTQTEIQLSLDPVFHGENLEAMRNIHELEDEERLLFYNQVRLPTNKSIQLMVTIAGSEGPNRYVVVAESSQDELPDMTANLKVGSATYQTQSDGKYFVFDEIILDDTVRNITLTLER
ncbi:MAG: hypothetical protein GYB64_07010 [Chloroflexi bacterium]|nr:hypothetical protein [Chloroflexota bacterium]